MTEVLKREADDLKRKINQEHTKAAKIKQTAKKSKENFVGMTQKSIDQFMNSTMSVFGGSDSFIEELKIMLREELEEYTSAVVTPMEEDYYEAEDADLINTLSGFSMETD